MPPIDFLRASHIIFSYLLPSTSDSQSTEAKTINILRGESGDDARRNLLEVGLALDRSAMASLLPRKVKEITYNFESHAFRSLSTTGTYLDAVTVLRERLLGTEGLAEIAMSEFVDIAANVAHIGSDASEEQQLYWRKRVKDFKYRLLAEVESYIRAVSTAVDSTANHFSVASSQTMNILLDFKQTAEAQQNLLIRLRAEAVPSVSNYDLDLVDQGLLTEFLLEAIAGSNPALFARRLQAMIDRCLPLRTFVDPYNSLSSPTGRCWKGVQDATRASHGHSQELRKSFERIVEELIDMMDYTHLPVKLDLRELLTPFMVATEDVFASIRVHADSWLEDVSEMLKKMQSELHPEVSAKLR